MNQKKDNNSNKKDLTRFRKKQVACFFVILGAGLLFVWIISKIITPEQWSWYWKLTIAYFIPPFGKETIMPLGLWGGSIELFGITFSGPSIPAAILGLSIWIFDLLACLAILTNWWLLELFIDHIPAFPFIGIRRKKPRIYKTTISLKKWYHGLHKKTQTLETKKYGKLLPVALFIFMFVPFQGTGAMSTTIIGSWLGFRFRETFFTVAIGSLLSTFFMILLYLGILRILG